MVETANPLGEYPPIHGFLTSF